jgi:putative copper export protein
VAQESYSAIFVALDYAHFLGASIWTGGLVSLIFWLRRQLQRQDELNTGITHVIVRQFSHFAIASTAAIAGSGLILSYFYGVRPNALFATNYSKLVLLKTGLFVATLAIASINQFIHLRKWNPKFEKNFAQGVLRESLFELVLIFSVLLVAGFLTRTATPFD